MAVAVQPPVLTAPQLADAFARNARLIAGQVAGLTHADSLIQPPARGNCLNWVLGHIAVHRDYILQTLGKDGILGEAAAARYDRGSEPILADGDGVLPLASLLAAIDQAQGDITATLAHVTAADLVKEARKGEPPTVAHQISFLFWHETYHVGQTEFLRQLAGTDDQVI